MPRGSLAPREIARAARARVGDPVGQIVASTRAACASETPFNVSANSMEAKSESRATAKAGAVQVTKICYMHGWMYAAAAAAGVSRRRRVGGGRFAAVAVPLLPGGGGGGGALYWNTSRPA